MLQSNRLLCSGPPGLLGSSRLIELVGRNFGFCLASLRGDEAGEVPLQNVCLEGELALLPLLYTAALPQDVGRILARYQCVYESALRKWPILAGLCKECNRALSQGL